MPENKQINAERTNVGVSITMWITIGVAVLTSGFNLYDRSNNIQFDNLKADYQKLEEKMEKIDGDHEKDLVTLRTKVDAQALIIAGYDKDIGHVKKTLDRVDKNVSSMNERITNAEIGSAIKRAISEWRGETPSE